VRVTSTASGSPHAVAVTGTGVATAVGNLVWSGNATALSFSSSAGVLTDAQTLTLQNQGSASATLSAVSLLGTQADQFVTGGACGSGVTLQAGASCTVTVAFDPTSTGSKSATLQVTSTNSSNPATIALSGSAAATATAGSGSNPNVGAGGCTLATSTSAFDPLLLAMGGVSLLVLIRRRRRP
jgi:hypothetical protein